MSNPQTTPPVPTPPIPTPPVQKEFQLIYVHASPGVILSKDDSIPMTDKNGKKIKLGTMERACTIVMKIDYTRKIITDETNVPEYIANISMTGNIPSVSIIELTDNGKKKVNMISFKISPLIQGIAKYEFPLLLCKNKSDEYVDYDNFVVNIQKITGNEMTHEHSESFIITTK